MAYFYDDWKDKKLYVEQEGQFLFNFGEAENSMIENIENTLENGTSVEYLCYLQECLKKGKLQLKWNIS